MAEAIIAIIIALIKAIFGYAISGSNSSAESKATALEKENKSIIESYEIERKIRDAIKEIKPTNIDPTDVFAIN